MTPGEGREDPDIGKRKGSQIFFFKIFKIHLNVDTLRDHLKITKSMGVGGWGRPND